MSVFVELSSFYDKENAESKYCEDLFSGGNMTLFTGQLSTAAECLQIS